ncbi:helix-turn-helix domain-containing protein [Ancylobacter amanitiformis]|uniref:Transcriptional regulator with XRE-family HTH domain n=1 Tax=Ancylobacter amanitiformis TaxID=217069 RepID=A0ABU0LQ68_9HYPH|nr:helix-turn-helix transcriptional regulator [Ancylobacter amanitiformis]MDQ0510824.1 transcriptional regulator with XRE-family HTH domain [Ancylobacter amanitiformis]
MTVGARIRAWREGQKLTLADLADRLDIDISTQTLGRYERGARQPDAEFLQALVRLGCDAAWLLTGVRGSTDDRPEPWQRFSPDAELFGRITDMIVRTYRDLNIPLAPVDLGRMTAQKYAVITEATEDAAERFTMVKLVGVQLRNELTTSEPGTGKRLA